MKFADQTGITELITLTKTALKPLEAFKNSVTDVNGIVKSNGSGGFSAAVAGTDYAAASHTHDYLHLSGGTLTGNLAMSNHKITDVAAPTADTDAANKKYVDDTIPFKPAGKSYLTFSSSNSFTLTVNDATKHWDGTLEYFASDKTWTTWGGTTTLSAVDNDGEYVLYLRGTGNTVVTGNSINYKWVLTGSDIYCIGNIENLLDYATVEAGNHPTMANSCYRNMFYDCTSLTQAPALLSTTLAPGCYAGMFRNCKALTQAPALPATTLAPYCYSNMFYKCTSLIKASALPATTLANYCYNQMFRECTSLAQAPALPATTLADYCYYSMFQKCSKIKLSSTHTGEYTQEYRIPTSGTGTIATNALNSMFAYTGGTFTDTPEINTTYYLSNTNTIVS